MPDSLAVRISNGLTLIILFVTLSEPLWTRLPWSLTPLATPLGKARMITNILICHLGLLFWAPALVLFVNLLRQKRWTGLIQSTALISFFVWNAWGATQAVAWFWSWVWKGMPDLKL